MIALICDGGCGARYIQPGPNTGAVAVPDGWVQVVIEQKQKATLVQHQCPKCFAAMQQQMREHAERVNPEVRNPVGSPAHITPPQMPGQAGKRRDEG